MEFKNLLRGKAVVPTKGRGVGGSRDLQPIARLPILPIVYRCPDPYMAIYGDIVQIPSVQIPLLSYSVLILSRGSLVYRYIILYCPEDPYSTIGVVFLIYDPYMAIVSRDIGICIVQVSYTVYIYGDTTKGIHRCLQIPYCLQIPDPRIVQVSYTAIGVLVTHSTIDGLPHI